MADVFLHVGLAKTGTTTIQGALEAHVAQLAAAGVLFPGGTHRAQRLAAYDLLGQRVRGDDRDVVPGSFRRLIDEISGYDGSRVVVSEEELSLARPRHVRRIARRLDGHRIFVLIGARDLARTLVSAWQQSVVTGGTTEWRDFLASALAETDARTSDGVAFWLRHDLLRVVDTWCSAVPREQIRIITVPRSASGSELLLDRFARAAELPAGTWATREIRPRNVSFGAAEVEVVRRLNEAVSGRLDLEQYRFVVEAGLRPRLRERPSRPLLLPPEQLPRARAYGERLVAELERRGLEIVGDPLDLVPEERPAPATPLDVVPESELLEAAEALLTALAVAHGTLFRRYRRAFRAREGRWPSIAEVAASTARVGAFGLQKALLRRADHDRLLARAARAYLEGTSRSRIAP